MYHLKIGKDRLERVINFGEIYFQVCFASLSYLGSVLNTSSDIYASLHFVVHMLTLFGVCFVKNGFTL